ncbi:hypothetical protein INR49_010436, partial [Caranx melampygus]
MLLGGLHFLDAAEQELDDMMLQSPLTSTPFSVKDILKLEQQQQQQQAGALELQHRAHTQQQQHLAGSPPQQQQQQQQRHFQSPPSCMLAGARTALPSRTERTTWPTSAGWRCGTRTAGTPACPRICTSTRPAGSQAGGRRAGGAGEQQRVPPVLVPWAALPAPDTIPIWFQNRRYKCKRQRQDKSLEAAGQHHPPPPRRVAVPVLVRDGKPCLGGTQSYPAAAPYASNPYSYNGYPAYTYNSPAYNSNYSCTYTSIPALPPSSTPSAFMNMNLGNVSGLGGSAQAQTHQGTAVTSCQGSLQGIRA